MSKFKTGDIILDLKFPSPPYHRVLEILEDHYIIGIGQNLVQVEWEKHRADRIFESVDTYYSPLYQALKELNADL